MTREMNLEIARQCFGSLILDYEWEFEDETGVYCRILNDGWYVGYLTARNREEAIEKFLSGNYHRKG